MTPRPKKLSKLDREWNRMTDIEKIERLRGTAVSLRAAKPEGKNTFFTSEEWADMCDDYADRIEAGEIIDGKEVEEEQSPEQLLAEAETARQMLDLLRRYDVGTLGALFERYDLKDDDSDA